jgi:hypothetical protein
MASMASPQGALVAGAASMGLNAAEGIGNAVGNMFGDRSRPGANENINYACVANLQITELARMGGPCRCHHQARHPLRPQSVGWQQACTRKNSMKGKQFRSCSSD